VKDFRRMLIFDFDGVLADSEPIHFECWNRAFDELLGIKIKGDYTQIVGLTLKQIFALWMESPAAHGLKVRTDKSIKSDLLKRKTELFYWVAAGRLKPMPGSIDLIRRAQAQDWYVAIASRAERIRLFRTLDLIGMPALFDLVLCGSDLIDGETDRKVHARVALRFDVDPAACVVVEDSATGVAGALACAIGRVIGFAPVGDGAVLRAAGAHEVVDNLAAIRLDDGN